MNRRQWLEQAGIALVAGLAGCKSGPPSGKHAGPVSTVSVGVNKGGPVVLQTPSAEFRILRSGYLQAALRTPKGNLTIDDPAFGSGAAPGYLVSKGRGISNFKYDFGQSLLSDASGRIGTLGKKIAIPASGPEGIEKTLTVEIYDDFPNLALVTESYRNMSQKPIRIDRVVANRRRLSASVVDHNVPPYRLWSFQGASYKWGENIIRRISRNFSQPNLMGGPTPKGMGGGVPVLAFWTNKVGVGMGHLEQLPLVLSMPVRVASDERINASMEIEADTTLGPGDTYSLPMSFVSVYSGDFYKALRMYSEALERDGWHLPHPGKQSYSIGWSSEGYKENVTPAEMLGTIPKLKELGIKWATLDYRWFDDFGDWRPRQDTFPDGAIKKLAEDFQKQGLSIKLWWQPLAADDGQGRRLGVRHAAVSKVVREHPEWLILDKDGKHARLISPLADTAALCPALPEVQRYFVRLTQRFIRDWGYDGSKLADVFSVPPCYNPKHHHKSPQDSVEAVPKVMQAIFETTRALRPGSVTQICPCGAAPNFALLPYMNQAVAADPVGSVQVRRRIKMYKALLGPQAAVSGDDVELTRIRYAGTRRELDLGEDFASTVGAGGVIATMFVWPEHGRRYRRLDLSPAKQKTWKKWTDLYNREMLSSATFLDLYNYGYDFPEAYAIRKDGKMYYAFYAPNPRVAWRGVVELRGLAAGQYRVRDYENEKDLGTINGAKPRLKTEFRKHLLLEVSKV